MRPRPPALTSDGAEPDRRAEIDRARHFGACLLAHQIGEPARQFAFVGLGEGAKQHVGDDEAEHMVAEKLQPLIAAGAVARAGQRGNMGERLVEQRGILEAIADAFLEGPAARGGAASLVSRQ